MKWLLPTACIVCKSYQANSICEKCVILIKREQTLRCDLCAAKSLHSPCKDCSHQLPAFDQTRCLSDYGGCLTQAVHDLKYQKQIAMASGLADGWLLIHEKLKIPTGTFLIPVPLSSQKLAARGFNQSWEITKILAKRLKLPTSWQLLQRHHRNQNQSELSRVERQSVLQDAFFLSKEHLRKPLPNRVILIDDVMTTGATLQSISKVLKSHGVLHIMNWVILKTPLHPNDSYRTGRTRNSS